MLMPEPPKLDPPKPEPPKCDLTGKDPAAKCEDVKPLPPPPFTIVPATGKNTLLTRPGCPFCADAKQILAKHLTSKKIGQEETTSPHGQELVKKYDIEGVPKILHEEEGHPAEVCQITTTGKALCPGNKVLDFDKE